MMIVQIEWLTALSIFVTINNSKGGTRGSAVFMNVEFSILPEIFPTELTCSLLRKYRALLQRQLTTNIVPSHMKTMNNMKYR